MAFLSSIPEPTRLVVWAGVPTLLLGGPTVSEEQLCRSLDQDLTRFNLAKTEARTNVGQRHIFEIVHGQHLFLQAWQP